MSPGGEHEGVGRQFPFRRAYGGGPCAAPNPATSAYAAAPRAEPRPGLEQRVAELEGVNLVKGKVGKIEKGDGTDLVLRVEDVEAGRLLEATADLVVLAVGMVPNSADGEAIRAAAAAVGALTLADTTQAAGWLPYRADDYDITVTGGYKWLLCPRGTAFMTVRPGLLDRVQPLYAGWYSGEEPWDSIYGLPLRLASDTSRLDLSPGWLAWVGTAAALTLLSEVGLGTIHEHDLRLANLVRAQLGQEPGDSSVVSLGLAADFDGARLDGLRTAFRAGRLRAGFHLYNTEDDVERLLSAISD